MAKDKGSFTTITVRKKTHAQMLDYKKNTGIPLVNLVDYLWISYLKSLKGASGKKLRDNYNVANR